jgi:hypothetical protein
MNISDDIGRRNVAKFPLENRPFLPAPEVSAVDALDAETKWGGF